MDKNLNCTTHKKFNKLEKFTHNQINGLVIWFSILSIVVFVIVVTSYPKEQYNNEESQYSCVAGCVVEQNYDNKSPVGICIGDLYVDSSLFNDSNKCIDFCELIVKEVKYLELE